MLFSLSLSIDKPGSDILRFLMLLIAHFIHMIIVTRVLIPDRGSVNALWAKFYKTRNLTTRLTWVMNSVSVIHGCLRHSAAVALFAGSGWSMGSKNWAKPSAASSSHSYFSTRTLFRGHGFSLEMRRSVPSFLKKSGKSWLRSNVEYKRPTFAVSALHDTLLG